MGFFSWLKGVFKKKEPGLERTFAKCWRCGAEVLPDAEFCGNCGVSVVRPAFRYGEVQKQKKENIDKLREEWRVVLEKIRREVKGLPKFKIMLPDKETPYIEKVNTLIMKFREDLDEYRRSILKITTEMISALQTTEEFEKLFIQWHSGTLLKDLQKEIYGLEFFYKVSVPMLEEVVESHRGTKYANYIVNFFTNYWRVMKFLNHVRYTELEPLKNRTIKTLKLT